jgi:osmotically-inducible protein OsmY
MTWVDSTLLVGGIFGPEEGSRSRDLGPAPIGSDPWLHAEVRAAIARETSVDISRVTIDVRDAIVTLRGTVPAGDAARIESAARTVQGIKTLRVELASG